MSLSRQIIMFVFFILAGCTSQHIPEVSVTSPVIGTLRPVPAGEFYRDSDRKNVSRVTKLFFISEKEITYPQFREVTGITISNNLMNDTPVKFVNWYHALIFCNRLSEREGLTPVYSIKNSTDPDEWMRLVDGFMPMGHSTEKRMSPVIANWDANGYRLPTEMEWVWAAMGAKKSIKGYAKAFSGSTGKNSVYDYAWVLSNSGSMSHQVGTKLQNELGLFDMSGNVMEWCWDWFGEYPDGIIESDTDAGRGAQSGSGRIVRGGSWRDDLTSLEFRSGSFPFDQDHYVGFRVVRSQR